jgi:hypothetical protein
MPQAIESINIAYSHIIQPKNITLLLGRTDFDFMVATIGVCKETTA